MIYSNEQLKAAGAVLARAFADYPSFCYVQPDAAKRNAFLPFMMTGLARYSQRYGGVYIDPEGKGAISWIRDGRLTDEISGFLSSGLYQTPFRLGLRAFWRLEVTEGYCKKKMKEIGVAQYPYIWTVGVEPSAKGQGIGGKLVRKAVEDISAFSPVVTLKTEKEENTRIYQALGFRVVHHSEIYQTGLRFWIMQRG